jgi:hypothetical protein
MAMTARAREAFRTFEAGESVELPIVTPETRESLGNIQARCAAWADGVSPEQHRAAILGFMTAHGLGDDVNGPLFALLLKTGLPDQPAEWMRVLA